MDQIYSYLIGIDIGNTNIKCIAASVKAEVLFSASSSTSAAKREAPGGMVTYYLDMEAVWGIVCGLLRDVTNQIRAKSRIFRIDGVGVTSMGAVSVCVDREGKQIPLIGLHPARSRVYRKYREAMTDTDYFVKTGYPFEPNNTAFLLGAMAEQHPEEFSRISSVLSVAGYISFRLTGELTCEPSLAHSIGLHDMESGGWWTALLEDLGLSGGQLGRMLNSGQHIGEIGRQIADLTGLPEKTSVYAGGHDYLCAAFATGCSDSNTILDVLGTFEIIASFHPAPQNHRDHEGFRVLLDSHVVPGVYSLMVEAVSGGQTEWLKQNFFGGDQSNSWGDLFRALDDGSPHGINKSLKPIVYLPMESGGNRRGTFLGLDFTAGRVDLLRAMIEGLCYLSKKTFFYQRSVTAGTEPVICAVGGGSSSSFWMQTKADILGMAITVPGVVEASAVGAALLSGVGAGVYSGFDEASQISKALGSVTYEPDKTRNDIYNDLYENVYLPARNFYGQLHL